MTASSSALQPYKTTPVFTEETLPEAIRNEHRTKAGTWGLLRVLQDQVTLIFIDPRREFVVTRDRPAQIPPEDTHFVQVKGPMQMQIEFYHEAPFGDASPTGRNIITSADIPSSHRMTGAASGATTA